GLTLLIGALPARAATVAATAPAGALVDGATAPRARRLPPPGRGRRGRRGRVHEGQGTHRDRGWLPGVDSWEHPRALRRYTVSTHGRRSSHGRSSPQGQPPRGGELRDRPGDGP